MIKEKSGTSSLNFVSYGYEFFKDVINVIRTKLKKRVNNNKK